MQKYEGQMMNSICKLMVVVFSLLGGLGTTQAAVVAQQFSITDNNTFGTNVCCANDVPTSTFFDPFDTSLGTLQSVTFTIAGSWSGQATFTNPYAFAVDAYLIGRAYTSFGPVAYWTEPLLEYVHPTTLRLAAGELITLTGTQSAIWLNDYSSIKDLFAGASPLEYRLLVEHSQTAGALSDLSGNGLAPPGGGNLAFDSYIYEMTQQVSVSYTYCPTNQDCAISVPEPGTIALVVLGLAGLGYSRRKDYLFSLRPATDPLA